MEPIEALMARTKGMPDESFQDALVARLREGEREKRRNPAMSAGAAPTIFERFGVRVMPEELGGFRLYASSPDILVIDDFYADPVAVRDFALGQEFVANEAHHKGRRTREKFLFNGLKERFETLLGPGVRIKGWLTHQYNGVFQYCVAGDRVVFHSDQQAYAGVVYLTPGAPAGSGTSFVRSRQTGLRRPPTESDAARTGESAAELERLTYGGKLLDPAAWEEVDRVGNVFNRLVIWDAKMIHAASGYFGSGLEDGRLFHLFFFDLEE